MAGCKGSRPHREPPGKNKMIVRATAAPAYLNHSPLLLRPRPGLAPLTTLTPGATATPGARDFGDTGWIDLDDGADAAELDTEADAADAALLRCVGCAAFATLVLALVSSLQLG
jgi:hypothetical protein